MVVVQAPEVVRAEGSLEMDQRAHCAAGHAEALRLEGAGPRAPLPSLHCCFSKCPPPGSSVLSHSSLRVWNWALTAPGRLPAIVLSKDWFCKVTVPTPMGRYGGHRWHLSPTPHLCSLCSSSSPTCSLPSLYPAKDTGAHPPEPLLQDHRGGQRISPTGFLLAAWLSLVASAFLINPVVLVQE